MGKAEGPTHDDATHQKQGNQEQRLGTLEVPMPPLSVQTKPSPVLVDRDTVKGSVFNSNDHLRFANSTTMSAILAAASGRAIWCARCSMTCSAAGSDKSPATSS